MNFSKFVRTLFFVDHTAGLLLIIAASIVVKGESAKKTVAEIDIEIKVYQFEPEM